ncbi:PepSY-associated TM helix domain-containing protein [Sphingomonas kyungheensis]|uniref:PepSY-associated TM helix domain-containing protein n=1 Tax=Sphingomonas kyungheensis TaxID=1069987 RepID=A0ABU8H0S0_9SPHN
MNGSLRRNMAWIHGWLGLVAGWLLFAMFLTGTASYFRPEITRWMQPEVDAHAVPAGVAATSAVRYLQSVGPDDEAWYLSLPTDREPVTRVFITPNAKAADTGHNRPDELSLDGVTGQPVHGRETRGGEHFYRFHFQLQLPYPWGRWLASLCALFMLGAIISGVVTHKRIFADFFTLRWNKGQRSWLDAHNVSAVLALPYHAVITYTGLITLVVMYMPYPILSNYAKPADFAQAAYRYPAETAAAGRAAPLVPVAPLIADAQARWHAPAAIVTIRNPNDAAAAVTIYRSPRASLNARGPTLTYSGATGRLIAASGDAGPALTTAGVMLGLHVAQFARPALRWTLFGLGLTGAAMVGTGLLLWTAARRRPNAAPFFGLRLVERLNIATIVGLPIGMAAFLLANRLIPADLPGRADREVAAMFWTWGVVALLQFARPTRRAWREGFAIGALAFAAIPLANAVTTGRGLPGSLLRDDTLFAAFDLAMLAIAILFGVASWCAGRPPRPAARRIRQTETIHA